MSFSTRTLLGAAFLLASLGSARGATDWEPAHTWVFVVGTLEWQHADQLAPFPKDKRRDEQLVRFFENAGVAQDHVVYLKDREATLTKIERELNAFLPRAAPGDLLIVYYCGHGYPSSDDEHKMLMASYDASDDMEGWSYDALVTAIERRFKGKRALVIVDCCHAGGAIRALKETGDHVAYAMLGASSSAQESTANWTFTESILDAFRGSAAVDLNRDGKVTLGEAQQFARREMKFAEDQESSWLIGDGWTGDFVLAHAEPRTDRRIGAHVQVNTEGAWWKARVLAVRDGEFQVFYYGYEQSDEQWVKPAQIKWRD